MAVLWRGDRQARRTATSHNSRLSRVFEALAALGIRAEPAVNADDIVPEVREQLLKLDGVLVWVDPISDGQNRIALDAMLRDVASPEHAPSEIARHVLARLRSSTKSRKPANA